MLQLFENPLRNLEEMENLLHQRQSRRTVRGDCRVAQALLQFQIRPEWFLSLGSQCESGNTPSWYGKVFSALFLEARGALFSLTI